MSNSWVQRGFSWLVFFLAGVVALLILAAAALWWWSGTEGSLDWTLRQIARSQPLVTEGVQGSLREGLQVKRLQWEQGGLKLEAFDVKLEWQPLALLRQQVRLDQFEAARLRIQDTRPPKPGTPPDALAIPLRVAIDAMKVGQIEWVAPSRSVQASDLAGAYYFNGSEHKVQLDSLRWAGGSYQGKATLGAAGKLPLDAALEGRFETTVPGSTTTLPLSFKATLQGPITDMQARALLEAPAAAASAPQGTASTTVTASATATARITPWAEQPIPEGQADFRQLDVGALWPQAPHTSLMGQVRVQPAGTGTWALNTEFRNELPGPWDQRRLPVERGSATGEWRTGGQALVRYLEARIGGGQVQASGQWQGTDRWTVDATLEDIDPAAIHSAMAPLPVSGRADLSGEGEAIAFEVDLKAQGRAAGRRPARSAGTLAATVGALELRQANARGRWANGLLTLPALEVRTADATLQGALELRPQARSGSGRASLEAPGLQVRAEGKLAEGSGGGTLRVTGSNLAPALDWLKRLPAMPEALGDWSAAGRGEVQLSWQGGWRDPAVQASVAVPLLEVSDGQRQEAGPGAAASWTVRDAAATVRGRLSEARVVARGKAELGQRRFGLELSGTGGRQSQRPPVWQGNVQTLNVTASDPALGTGTWSLRLEQAFDVRWSAGSFDAGAGEALVSAPPRQADRGRPALGPTVLSWEPVRWRPGELQTAGRLTGLPMAWVELIGGPQLSGAALSGDMVFDARWDASLGAVPRVRASVERRSGDLSVLAETMGAGSTRVRAGVREARLSLVSEGEAVTATLVWDSERGGIAEGRLVTRLAPGGAAGWHWPDNAPLSGGLQARLPRIGVWSLLAPPGWRLRGSLVADLAVAGTKADPLLSGTLVADDLALRSVVDGIQLQGGHMRARLEGRQLIISEFELHGVGQGDAGGALRATGAVGWTGEQLQARMTAQITRLRASIRTDRELTVSGRLTAQLDSSGTNIAGDLRVDQARIELPDENTPRLGDDVVVRGAGGAITRDGQAALPRQARPLDLAVDIDLGNDFRVRGMGINTRLEGSLTLTARSIAQPRLNGTIRTAGGEYRAYGQWLDIERGVIRFTGPIDNPALDILAVRANMLERVGVQVTGRALAPYIRLYSETAMSDVEKLSLLVTGRRTPSGGAEAALVQQAALALLASRTGGTGPGIAGRLGLDVLSFSREGADGPSVTLGKRFGRNFYAAYERSLSGALGTLFIFYDLTRRLTLRAETGERTAVDLIFTFAFD